MPDKPTAATLAGAPGPIAWRPSSAQAIEFLQASAVMGETVRYRMLDRMEAFYRGQQYSHQSTDFWGRNPDISETISPNAVLPAGFVPTGPGTTDGLTVRDCRPTAPKGLARTIVKRYTGLLLGETRKPKLSVDQDPETDAFLEAVREQSLFWQTMRAARDLSGATGAVCVTAHLREGEFSYDIHNSKNVTPVWRNKRKWQLSAILVIERFYQEEDTVTKDGKPGEVAQVQYLNRRIITEQADVVYQPVRLEDSLKGEWVVDPTRSAIHGLGYFPGVWIQNHADTEMDGDPDCDQAWQTIDTIDRLLSQTNRGTLLNLDPTTVLAYDDKTIAAQGGVKKGSDNALHVGAQGDAKYMELAGTGTTAGLALLGEFMKTVRDLTGYVPIDPDKISGAAQSAKAMEILLEPMIERADDLRAQFGPAFVTLQKMTLAMARAFEGKKINLPDGRVGRFEFQGLTPRKVQVERNGVIVDEYVPQKLGPGGHVTITWPKYFQPTAEDDRKEIDNATAANAAGFITKTTGARKIAGQYGVTDVEGEVAAAKAEHAEETSSMLGNVEVSDGGETETSAPAGGGNIELTGTTTGVIIKVNEGRRASGLPPLLLPDGSLDPDGFLSVAEYQAKIDARSAAAAAAMS